MRISRASRGEVVSVMALLDEAAAWQEEDRGIDMWRPGTFDAEVHEVANGGDLHVARRECGNVT
jgi:hypothetical protein